MLEAKLCLHKQVQHDELGRGRFPTGPGTGYIAAMHSLRQNASPPLSTGPKGPPFFFFKTVSHLSLSNTTRGLNA
jgi:hypothetical protein